jgi:hypothetical protein
MNGKALPVLQFLASAPVYFDRHTLSISKGVMSMFTMDGRMRFDLNLGDEEQMRFKERKLQEIVLRAIGEKFTLSFSFSPSQESNEADASDGESLWPEYVVIRQDEADLPLDAQLVSKQSIVVNSFGVSP